MLITEASPTVSTANKLTEAASAGSCAGSPRGVLRRDLEQEKDGAYGNRGQDQSSDDGSEQWHAIIILKDIESDTMLPIW